MKEKDRILLISLTVAVVLGAILFFLPADHATKLHLAVAYTLLIFVFFAGLVVLAKMVLGEIDLKFLLNEHGGGASMSRFQLLIFTFGISVSFFLIVVHDNRLPELPANVLALLGISATTYGVSKGIQAGSDLASKDPAAAAEASKKKDA